MKAHLEHHNSHDRVIYFLVAIALGILFFAVIKTRPFLTFPQRPGLTHLSSMPIGSVNPMEINKTPAYLTGSYNFVENIIEVKEWMLNLDGWTGSEDLVDESFFVHDPFVAVQPWMMQPEEWLNPGYLEEMIALEPWMTNLEAWENDFTTVIEEFAVLEDWMLDLSLWTNAGIPGFSVDSASEEWVILEPWMLSDEDWFFKPLVDADIANAEFFDEPVVEVKAWMVNVEEWLVPFSSSASENNGEKWQ